MGKVGRWAGSEPVGKQVSSRMGSEAGGWCRRVDVQMGGQVDGQVGRWACRQMGRWTDMQAAK